MFTYFQMLGKILNPKSDDWRTSKLDFNFGFCDVYSMLRPPQTEVTRRFRR